MLTPKKGVGVRRGVNGDHGDEHAMHKMLNFLVIWFEV